MCCISVLSSCLACLIKRGYWDCMETMLHLPEAARLGCTCVSQSAATVTDTCTDRWWWHLCDGLNVGHLDGTHFGNQPEKHACRCAPQPICQTRCLTTGQSLELVTCSMERAQHNSPPPCRCDCHAQVHIDVVRDHVCRYWGHLRAKSQVGCGKVCQAPRHVSHTFVAHGDIMSSWPLHTCRSR